jgi:hypothetical protein
LPSRHSTELEIFVLERDRARCDISVAPQLSIRVELVYALADHVGGGGATNSGGGARLTMSSTLADAGQSKIDPPLDAEVNLDDVEYRRTMDRVTGGDEPGGTVSAFNSSI